MTTKENRFALIFSLGLFLVSVSAPLDNPAFAATKTKQSNQKTAKRAPSKASKAAVAAAVAAPLAAPISASAAPETPSLITELPGEPLRITIPSLDNAVQGSEPVANRTLQALFSKFLERGSEREILSQPLPFFAMATPNASMIYSVASQFVAMGSNTNEPPLWEKVLASVHSNRLPFFAFLPQPTTTQIAANAKAEPTKTAALQPEAPTLVQATTPTPAKPVEKAEAKTEKPKKNERKLAKAEGGKGSKASRIAKAKANAQLEKEFAARTRTEPLPPIASNDLPPPPSNPISLAPDNAESFAQLSPAAGGKAPTILDDEPEDNAQEKAEEKTKTAENESLSESPREDFSMVKLFDQLFPAASQAADKPAEDIKPAANNLRTAAIAHASASGASKKPYRDLASFEAPTTIVASTDSIPDKKPIAEKTPELPPAPAPEQVAAATPPAPPPSLEVALNTDAAEEAPEAPIPAPAPVAKEPKPKKEKIRYKRDKKTGKLIALKPKKKKTTDYAAAARSKTVPLTEGEPAASTTIAQANASKLPWHEQQAQAAAQQDANAPQQVNPLAVISSLFTEEVKPIESAQAAPPPAAAQHAAANDAAILAAMNAPVVPVTAEAMAQLAPAAGNNPPAATLDDMVLVPSTPDVPSASSGTAPLPPKDALVPAAPAAATPIQLAPAPAAPADAPVATAPAAPSAPQQPAAQANAGSPAPAQPAPTEDEKQALLNAAPPPPQAPATPAGQQPQTADAVPPAPPAPAAPANVLTPPPAAVLPATASEQPAPAPAPAAPVATAPAPATAAPVETVTQKKIEEPAKPTARALLLETERQVKNKRGTSSKELLAKMPKKLQPEPQLNELVEPFVIDRSKPRRETFDPTDDVQVQNAKHESMGVKIEVKTPRVDTNYELEKAYNALMGGQATVAQEIYRKVLDADPNNVLALFGMATTYHRSGQFEKARTLYAKILTLDPDNRDALNNFLALVSSDAPEESLAQLEKLEANNPEFSPIPAQMAVIYQKLGNPEKAMQKMLRAVSLEPENLTYRYNLAVLMDRQGRREEAASLYRQLVSAYQSGASIPGDLQKIQERLTFLSSTSR